MGNVVDSGSQPTSVGEGGRFGCSNHWKKRCPVEIITLVAFAAAVLLLTLVGFYSQEERIPGGDLRRLDLNGSLEDDLSLEKSFFYDLTIPAGTLLAVSARMKDERFSLFEPEFDITLGLLRRPDELIAFNHDISPDNFDCLIFYQTGDSEENVVVEVGKLDQPEDDKVSFTSFNLSTFEVKEIFRLNEIFSQFIDFDEILLSSMFLEAGKTYPFYAFTIDGAFNEVDSAIRIRTLDGEEIVEAFQSTIGELTARVLFTPQESALYIIEVRTLFQTPADLNVLVFEADVIPLETDFEISDTFPDQPILTTESTVLELELDANVQYNFNFTIELDLTPELETELNVLGIAEPYSLALTTVGALEALSIRVIEKDTNEVLDRFRTDLKTRIPEESFNTTIGDLQIKALFLNITSGPTTFDFVPDKDMKILLDVSRINPDYFIESPVLDQIQMGTFDLTVTKNGEISEDEIAAREVLVDKSNIFPECDIDQSKYTIDGGCEPGIALYCRNEFFPELNQEAATKAEFSDICDCVSVLCSSLPSGENVSDGFQMLLNGLHGFFVAISVIFLISYLLAMLDLLVRGGMAGWLRRGFYSWTICALFFTFAIIYSITQIMLNSEVENMQKIAENFDNKRIPLNAGEVTYYYYGVFSSGIFDYGNYGYYYDYDYEEFPFLNDEALNSVPSTSFNELRVLILANLISFVFLQSLAVVSFLDVSVVWIESSRATLLNRLEAQKRFKYFKWFIRALEFGYFWFSLGIANRLSRTNGESYNVLQSVVIFLTAIGTSTLYIIGRKRLRIMFTFNDSTVSVNNGIRKYWQLIRTVSTIVVYANCGIIIVQLYSMARIRNFEELVEARNDSVALGLIMFEYLCILVGEACVFAYFFVIYRDFRRTLNKNKSKEDAPVKKLYHSVEQTSYNVSPQPNHSSDDTKTFISMRKSQSEGNQMAKQNLEELL